MSPDPGALEHCRRVLRDGGYVVDVRTDAELGAFLLAETMYALVMAVVAPLAETERFIEDAQATLTQLAAQHPSPRSWDLYLVLVVPDDKAHYDSIRECYEADTRYARKLIVTGDEEMTERLLRSLLPLRAVPAIEVEEPLNAVRDKLLMSDLEPVLVDAVLAAFVSTGEVRLP